MVQAEQFAVLIEVLMGPLTNFLRPVRICRVVTTPITFETLMREQLGYIAAQGMDLTLVSSCGPALEEIAKSLDISFYSIMMARKPAPFRDMLSLFALVRLFREKGFDIVHSSTPKAGLLTAVAGALARVRIRIHTFTGQVWVGLEGLPRRIIRQCDWLIGYLDTRCYADSVSQRDFLVEERVIAGSKLYVLGDGSISGVNLERFNPGIHGGKRAASLRRELGVSEGSEVILFVGRLTKDKGICELVSAFRMLKGNNRDVELILVGPFEPERDPLPRETLYELSNNPKIHVVGFCREPEKYMGLADFLCLPSYREGFGSVVIEAAAMGLPSVASRINGLVDAVVDGETGILVPARNVDALKCALEKMLSSPEIRSRMGRTARERAVRNFDSNIVNQLVVEEYRKLVSNQD